MIKFFGKSSDFPPENVSFSGTSFLDVSIFYRFRSEQFCSLVVFGFQGTDLISNNRNGLPDLRSVPSRASHYVLIKPSSLTNKLDTLMLLSNRIAHC